MICAEAILLFTCVNDQWMLSEQLTTPLPGTQGKPGAAECLHSAAGAGHTLHFSEGTKQGCKGKSIFGMTLIYGVQCTPTA